MPTSTGGFGGGARHQRPQRRIHHLQVRGLSTMSAEIAPGKGGRGRGARALGGAARRGAAQRTCASDPARHKPPLNAGTDPDRVPADLSCHHPRPPEPRTPSAGNDRPAARMRAPGEQTANPHAQFTPQAHSTDAFGGGTRHQRPQRRIHHLCRSGGSCGERRECPREGKGLGRGKGCGVPSQGGRFAPPQAVPARQASRTSPQGRGCAEHDREQEQTVATD